MIEHQNISLSPKIVRAWFDTVLNPILTGLRIQQDYLVKTNWTWRYRGLQFEVIVPAHTYINVRYWDNYEHLVAYNGDVQDRLIEQGTKVEQLRKACEALQQALEQDQQLHDLYKRYTSPETLEELGTTTDRMFGGYAESDHIAYLAQLIINHTEELPDYYTAHPMWNRYRKEFMALLHTTENQQAEAQVLKYAANLFNVNEDLVTRLKELRFKLSNEYGEPLVSPITATE